MTSQIFANIYLNELDRFIKHHLKIKGYLRYGDDFVIFSHSKELLEINRLKIIEFIEQELKLSLNLKSDIIKKTRVGLFFLGTKIYPKGKKLNDRNRKRIFKRLNYKNFSSYRGLIYQQDKKILKELDWKIKEIIDE